MGLPPEGERIMASGSGGSAAPKAAAAEGPASGGPEAGPASGGPEAGPASGGLTDTVWRAALAAAMTHTLEFGSPPDLERWSEAQLAALLRDPEPPAPGPAPHESRIGTPGKKGDDAANRGIKRPLWVERPRGDNRPRGQTTEEWRKPTEEELKRNPKMRSDAFIPATPTSLMSNGLEIPPHATGQRSDQQVSKTWVA